MPTYQRSFIIAPRSGSVEADLSAISGSIGVINNTLTEINGDVESLKNKPLATPQKEVSSGAVATNYYQLTTVSPVFVGNAGSTAAMVIGFAIPVVGASGNEILITDITSDAAGLNSVVGMGYVLNPFVRFSEPIPNQTISLRYGTQNTLANLPEGVLLIEPMKIAEVQADTQAWIATIKGENYDAPVPTNRSLLALDNRLNSAESDISYTQSVTGGLSDSVAYLSNMVNAFQGKIGAGLVKEFGIAPEFSNMVFDDEGIVEADGTWMSGVETGLGNLHTYLEWSTNVPSAPQSNRIRIMVKLPRDFGLWHSLEPIKIWYKGEGNVANVALKVSLHDSFGTLTNLADETIPLHTNFGAWNQYTTSNIANGIFSPEQWMCLTLEASAQDLANKIKIGRIDFKYITV